MKKYVSRSRNRITLILMVVFVAILLTGRLLENRVLMLIAMPIFIVGIILMFYTNRCPYCGEFFRGIYWAKQPTAGYCRKCGKIIEFNDSPTQDNNGSRL